MSADIQNMFFFILGAAKCGTTSVAYYLGQHPDICMSQPKEPFFFEAEFEKGNEYYRKKYFSHWQGERVAGDARHRNLYLPYIPERIKSTYPNAKFIVVVRNPLERAHSHWWHWYSRGVEKCSFAEVVEADLQRLVHGPFFKSDDEIDEYVRTLDFRSGYSPYEPYVACGHYAEQIQRYTDFFGNEAVKLVFFSDMQHDPFSVVTNVFSFFGLPFCEKIDVSPQNMAMSISRLRLLHVMRDSRMKQIVPVWARRRISHWMRNARLGERVVRPPMGEATRTILLNHYAPHISKLEKSTNRKLDAWYYGEEIPHG